MQDIGPVIAMLAVILVAAKIGGDLAMRLGQPSVLGELLAGIVLGNLGLVGFHALEPIKASTAIELLSGLGVVILLFEVGLESTVGQMMKVGLSALLVATLGVVAPFALGWAVSVWLEPDGSTYLHAFHGATLCATSVGITARVFRDLGRGTSDEARIILGAAVIDDVMGLVILSAVTGMIVAADAGQAFSPGAVGWPLLKATIFLVGALGIGVLVTPKLFSLAARLRSGGTLLATGLMFCF